MSDVYALSRLNWALRVSVAQSVTVFFLVFSLVSFSLPYVGEAQPFFLLMAIYYWAIFRPTLLPPAATFGLGLILDLLSGVPLGFNTVTLLVAQWIVRDQRLFLMGQPYIMVWIGFAVTCGVVALAQALIFFAMNGVFPPVEPIAASAIFSIFLFPLVSLLLNLTHRLLPVAHQPFH